MATSPHERFPIEQSFFYFFYVNIMIVHTEKKKKKKKLLIGHEISSPKHTLVVEHQKQP